MSAQTPGKEGGDTAGPAAKRRRVELANSTLRKPFRSPLLRRPPPAGSTPVSAGLSGSGSGSGTSTEVGTGTTPVVGHASVAASPSLRLGQRRGQPVFGLESGKSTAGRGLGLGQSPLRFKTRVGEDREREREIPDSEDEDEGSEDDDDHDPEEIGNWNSDKKGKTGKDEDTATTTSANLSASFQIPASPSLRTAVGEARGGNLQGFNIQLEGRRYPPPTSSKSASASTSTPTGMRATPGRPLPLPLPSSARNTGTGSGISHQQLRNYTQTPSKKPTVSSSSLLFTAGRNPQTPSTPKLQLTNNPNTPTSTTNHGKDGLKKEVENKPPNNQDEEDFDFPSVLETANRQIQAEISQARKQLDIAKQARRIQEKGSIEELEALIEKWKSASRQAAEDLFELIKARVDGMGGGKAWRDSRRRQVQGWGFEEEDEYKKRTRRKKRGDYDEYGDGEDSEEEGQEDEGDEEEEGQDDDVGDDEKNNEEEEEEDTGFTMAMMLQSLNIEPKVLGWDPGEEKWRD